MLEKWQKGQILLLLWRLISFKLSTLSCLRIDTIELMWEFCDEIQYAWPFQADAYD